MTLTVTPIQVGVVGVIPRIMQMSTTDNYATITTAGYLNSLSKMSVPISATDVFLVSYDDGVSFGIFTVTIATGVITLVPYNIAPSSIVNADIAANAAIAFSKLAALPSGQILVGSASNVAAAIAVTGDVTIDDDGVTALTNNSVSLENLDSGIAPSHIIVFSGRITWSGSGASLTTAVTGVAATDQIVATIRSAPSQAAYLVSATTNTNQVILTLSAANTSNDAVITYTVLRAAS